MTSNVTKLEPKFYKFGAFFKANALRSSSGLIINSRDRVHSKVISIIGRIRWSKEHVGITHKAKWHGNFWVTKQIEVLGYKIRYDKIRFVN